MSVQRWSMAIPGIICVIGIMAVGALAENRNVPAGWLITPEEAAMAPAPETSPLGGGLIDAGRDEISAGPLIEILKPADGGQVPSPLEVAVRFVPRLEPVDVASLKVSIVKFITIDITDRIRPYATAEGIQLKEAKIPSGKHRVRIALSDTAGGTSVKELSLEVL